MACATKLIPESILLRDLQNDYYEKENHEKILEINFEKNRIKKELRLVYEEELIFLGFIVISNHLKTDTVNVVKELKESGCQMIMATGDNPFTSISVAKQSSLIENDNICLLDIEDNELLL